MTKFLLSFVSRQFFQWFWHVVHSVRIWVLTMDEENVRVVKVWGDWIVVALFLQILASRLGQCDCHSSSRVLYQRIFCLPSLSPYFFFNPVIRKSTSSLRVYLTSKNCLLQGGKQAVLLCE